MEVYSHLVKPYRSSHKKRLGQHFLRDTGVINRIVRWMKPQPEDTFLEIGAGDGALSSRLAPFVGRLIAVEFDMDCIPRLKSELASFESVTIIPEDILHLDLVQAVAPLLKPDSNLRIAGNLPYNIGTAIIEKFLHCDLPVLDMSFMLQLEVAQRITADPESRRYGYLSIHCQHHCDVQLGFRIAPSCFVPRPKVSSAMISLRPKQIPQDPGFESDLEAIGKAAFGHRRKTLANSLGKHPVFGAVSNGILKRAKIDGSRRAESLSVAEFEKIACVFNKKFKKPKL